MDNTQETMNNQQPTGNDNQQSAEQTNAAEARIAELEAQLEQARKTAEENWNRFVRERADVDNIRKRMERDVAGRVLHQKKALFQQLLDVMDNVERALRFQETMDKQQLQQTLRMLHWQMNEVLRKEGVNPVPAAIGEKFNPYIHEAFEAVETNDEPDKILEVVRAGYTLGSETLRPASVKVSKAITNNENASESQNNQ
ncbi:molecular chaperone GrpE [Thermosporothrix hazakensis]|jgi:molecular chaperone GrpE|uniref:Protein GrpE n=1 Tax=Thermosporothrix hazakensis TaxID=644383 RepID=A0A326U204_THEHA|nr:nucleotide exchange factor GrpE [Thermosporothrix hazakensis]PZW24186.1 molecular chaperone GrpE [Thermosporothrix hazakensis]GCE47818.1 protein GrpE [Thermosporothrix hazakensis]